MSKKDEIKFDDDLENSLDGFLDGLDLDDDIDLFEEVDERKPLSLENLKEATKKEFKKPPSVQQITKALEDTLPEEISPEYDMLKEIASSTSDTISKNMDSLKKEMAPITKMVDKMSEKYLGQDNKLKKILEYLKPDEERNNYINSKNLESEVADVIKSTLADNEDISNKINAMNQVMEDKRTASTNDILKDVYKELSITRVYTTDVTAPFQRKSLELQYRSNFYLKELLEATNNTSKEQTELLKSIMKNTGLPDVVKQRQMEMFHADMKQQFRTKIMDKFVTNNPLLTNIKENINNKINGVFNQVKDGVSNLAMGVEMGGDMADDIDKNQLGATMLKEQALKSGFLGINKFLMKNDTVRKGLSAFKQVFDDPQSLFGGLKDKIKGDGYFAETMRSILGVGESLVKNPVKTGKLDTRRLDLDSAATLDVRTKMAVNKVIPGYLKKIHAEIRASRLNFKGSNVDKFELSYSHAQEKFVSTGSLGDILKKNIAEQMKDSTSSNIDRLSYRLNRVKSGVSEKNIDKISKHLALASTKTTKSGLALLNSDEAKNIIPKNLQKDYDKLVQAANKKAETDLDFIDDMRRSVDNVRRNIPDVSKFFQELMKNGDMGTLEKLGIVEYNSLRDEFVPNEANILKIMFETYGIRDQESIENATGEVTEEASKLGRMIKKDIVRGRKKYRNVKKAIQGDPKAREEIKKEVKKLADDVKDMTQKTIEKTKKTGKKVKNKAKEFKDSGKLDDIKSKAGEFKASVSEESNEALIRMRELKEEINTALTTQSGTITKGKAQYFHKTEEEQEEETFDQIVKEKELEFKALKLIDSAIESNSNEAIEEVKRTLKARGLDKYVNIKKKLRDVDKFMDMKKSMGKEALKNIDPKKDPEGANRSLLGMMKSGLNMIPFGKTIGLIGKSTWWLMKRGWKNEAWLAKNLYWPVLKGIMKSPLTLGKGAWGATKFAGRTAGKLGKFAFGTGRKMARGAGSLFLNGLSRTFFGKNLVGDTLLGGKKSKDKKSLLGKAKDKLINGMTKEEYEKKKGRKRKKKPGLFKQLLGMLMKVGSGLLGAVTMLGGKVGLLAAKALPALVSGIGAIGGKIAGFFKSPDAPDPKNPNKKPDPKNPKADPKNPKAKSGGLLDKIKRTIKGIKDKIVKPIAKKIGPKGAMKVAGKLAKKLLGMLVPGAGWAMLLWSVAAIGILVAKGKSIASAICEELLGFDPWDDNSQVLDENGNPVKPDPEDLKEAEEKNAKQNPETKEEKNQSQNKGTEIKIEKQEDPTFPKNAQDMMKYGIRPADISELKSAGLSDEEIKEYRKEEQFEFMGRKANWDGNKLSESDTVRQIYMAKLKSENHYLPRDYKTLIEIGRTADAMAAEKFGDKYTAYKMPKIDGPSNVMTPVEKELERIKEEQIKEEKEKKQREEEEKKKASNNLTDEEIAALDGVDDETRRKRDEMNRKALEEYEAKEKAKEEEKAKLIAEYGDDARRAKRQKEQERLNKELDEKIDAELEAEKQKELEKKRLAEENSDENRRAKYRSIQEKLNRELDAKIDAELEKEKQQELEKKRLADENSDEKRRERYRSEQERLNRELDAKIDAKLEEERKKEEERRRLDEEEEEKRREKRRVEQAKLNREADAKIDAALAEEEKKKKQNQSNLTEEELAILDGSRKPSTIPEQVNTVSKDAPGSPVAEMAGKIARENAEPKSTGSCARYVRTALEEAGYQEPPGRPLSAYQYETTGFINKYGFSKVDTNNPLTFKPKPGDISITKAFNNHKHGHIAIYDGQNWVSDFKQKSISIYRDLPTSNAKDYISIYRDSTAEGSGGDNCQGSSCDPNIGYNLNRKFKEPKQDVPLNVNHKDLIDAHSKNTGMITEVGNLTNQHLEELIEINKRILDLYTKTLTSTTPSDQPKISDTPTPVTNLSRALHKQPMLIGKKRT